MSKIISASDKCLTATEIAERFRLETAIELHPTNVGNAAKVLGLDYLEQHQYAPAKPTRLYAEADLPAIFLELQKLADRRSRYNQV